MREQKLVESTPVLQNHSLQRVAAVAFPQAENHVNAAELLPLTSKGSLGAEATELLGADS